MSTALLILGMHRSGTSALARAVNLLGAHLGDNLMEPDVDNVRGFWEQEDIIALHERLLQAISSQWDEDLPLPEGWEQDSALAPFRDELHAILHAQFSGRPLWAVKDPRLSILLPFWLPILKQMKVEIRCLIALRHPLEVAASLKKRDHLPQQDAVATWFHHTLMAERHSRPFPRACIAYDALLDNWHATLTTAMDRAGLCLPSPSAQIVEQIDRFLSPALRHHTSTTRLPDTSPLYIQAAELYAALKSLAREGSADTALLDRLYSQWHAPFAMAEEPAASLQSLLERTRQARSRAHYNAVAHQFRRDELGHAVAQLKENETALRRANDTLENRIAALVQERDLIYASHSWKLTGPLRQLRRSLEQKISKEKTETQDNIAAQKELELES